MSWGLGGWKRQSDSFHLSLGYGDYRSVADPFPTLFRNGQRINPGDLNFLAPASAFDLASLCKFRVQLDWSAGEDEEQVALKLQSQLMVTLPVPQDEVQVKVGLAGGPDEDAVVSVKLSFTVQKKREPLKVVSLSRTPSSSPQNDGLGVLTRLLGSGPSEKASPISVAEELLGYTQYWRSLSVLNLSGCLLSTLPVELSRLPMLERIYLDNNKLSSLPSDLGQLKYLQVLKADYNILVSVPAELRQCESLVELSLEYNKLVRPLLDFRSMVELRVLRLFGNPLEFLPEILPCTKLHYLSLANVRIDADENVSFVNVLIESENTSYFVASKHKLSAFFALIFRFSSCQHPLLASALAKITQDDSNRTAIGKDESAVRQLLSMMLSENRYVVQQACLALSSLASDASLVLRLMKADIMQPVESIMKSSVPELLISALQVIANLAFSSDAVTAKILTKEMLKRLKMFCGHDHPEVQRFALLAIGNLAFGSENRHILVASESLREMLLHLSAAGNTRVCKAAIRALAILGENEYLRRAVKGRPIGKQGLRILSMDGGGMRGLAIVQMLRRLEQGTGKHIHEIFDLICGTSTGGMLAVALGIKRLTLDSCEDIYKNLGKLVFTDTGPKDNEAATWREKLDQLYKSSSQNFRVVVHGSKHNADEFERLLKEMCSDEDGDLLIESAIKGPPKVFVVSSLVSVTPAQPFVFRNYQYPAGTPETTPWTCEEQPAACVFGTPATAAPLKTQVGLGRRSAFIGSCKHCVWEAIRASSAAPYYLDDFSSDLNRWQDGAIVANNPAIIAIREAQLLWPDSPIGCLISIGCGNLPTKPRGKGGWRYLDTGQVLIESACSVERAEEALDTLLPMLPHIQYFRFNPVDERCGMELDETDPIVWAKLEAATQEYIDTNNASFQAACDFLVPVLHGKEAWSERTKNVHNLGKGRSGGSDEVATGLGWRRGVLLVEAWGDHEPQNLIRHTHLLESFCTRHGVKVENLSNNFRVARSTIPATASYASPLFTGSFPASPLFYSPEINLHQLGRLDLVPTLCLDGGQNPVFSGKATDSPPKSPPLGPPQLSGPILSLSGKLQNSPQVGIVHFALQCDSTGFILGWQSDVFSVAEPGESAEAFLHTVMTSMCIDGGSRINMKKQALLLRKILTVANLVAECPRFSLGKAVYRFIGRQTQVLSDDREVGAYLFQRTFPATYLRPEDARWMAGAWRERIIICTSKYGPPASLIKAFLDAGAKAIIASTADPPNSQKCVAAGDVALGSNAVRKSDTENGRFTIGEEEEEDSISPSSPDSDWEDSDFENSEKRAQRQENEEKDLSSFVSTLYNALFKKGVGAESALQQAMEAYPKYLYKCHTRNF